MQDVETQHLLSATGSLQLLRVDSRASAVRQTALHATIIQYSTIIHPSSVAVRLLLLPVAFNNCRTRQRHVSRRYTHLTYSNQMQHLAQLAVRTAAAAAVVACRGWRTGAHLL